MINTAKRVVDGNNPTYTVVPLREAAAKASDNRPTLESEFCRPGDLHRLFGIRRGQYYALEKAGLVKSVSLRRPGSTRGSKLVSVLSVRSYLNTLLEQQPATQKM